MDMLKEIVQNILIIVLLNVLLEMIMPRSNLNRYIKLVMGLFIITAVLNPILTLINKDYSIMTFTLPDSQQGELESLISKGKSMSDEMKQSAAKEYEEKIAQQVMAFARLDGKADVQKVVVRTENNPDTTDFGSLKEIVIYVDQQSSSSNEKKASAKGNTKVEPVEINVNSSNVEEENNLNKAVKTEIQNLQQVLADFYGINPDSISVVQAQE